MSKDVVNYIINNNHNLQVILEDETVWLSQTQMAELFDSSKQNISLHINNVFKENELDQMSTVKEYLTAQIEGSRKIKRKVNYYNLDVIISVGYRVKSNRGTQFRIWATKVLKEYLLKGYLFQHRIDKLEERVLQNEIQIKDLIEHSLPPKQGIFYDGQVFDAYLFVTSLVRKPKNLLYLLITISMNESLTFYQKEIQIQKLKYILKKIIAVYRLILKNTMPNTPKLIYFFLINRMIDF
jgi:prophage antirepressor-like protein